MSKARVIAFYLPQYHPTKHNNEWWGKGFTEWTNVGKAKPLFKGHYQPKVPADLGYYDLRLPEIREEQARLAKEAGIEGFCYYHYWFEYGKEELDLPFKEVVRSGEPDFPFCLCWANESWHCKFWNPDGTASKQLLVEQKYLGKEDNEKHFYSLLSAFKDDRYMKYKGKLIFMIYRGMAFENVSEFISQWNDLAKENGLIGFHFITQTAVVTDIPKLFDLGFDAVNILRLRNFDITDEKNKIIKSIKDHYRKIAKKPFIYEYKDILPKLIGKEEKDKRIYPSLIPNWDHTPRSGNGGYLLNNSEPVYFKQHILDVIETIKQKDNEDRIVFLKSWNEWGEGNYVEPDLRYGHGMLQALKECLT